MDLNVLASKYTIFRPCDQPEEAVIFDWAVGVLFLESLKQ